MLYFSYLLVRVFHFRQLPKGEAMIRINNNWEFTENWSEEFKSFTAPGEAVRLPHNVRELPLHYADPADYEMLCGYRRKLYIAAEKAGRRFFLQFDGAAHIATVYVNGEAAAVHQCGYTAFRAEITDLIRFGADNEIAVRLDTSEDPSIPPFGYVVDYLTYGGIYRDVWLDERPQDYIEDIFVYTPAVDKAHVEVTVKGSCSRIMVRILDAEGKAVYELAGPGNSSELPAVFDLTLTGARVWEPDDPYRYSCEAILLREDGSAGDIKAVRFGFRTARFEADGFYLNGKKTFLRGLNRHQSYPYIGYAAPEALQREDARILKEELACTVVRTSHYPQSQYFIDECDRLGLMVFTEIPGWQHIGDEAWKEQAIANTEEMVRQYRNHPSIVLWGVRINESPDDHDFYIRTNEAARRLDPSRETSGVRALEKSELLEDVYAYNDFSHSGSNPGVKERKDVMNEAAAPLIITEHNGHMFPTKSFDSWQKRQEQALRHARVQGAAAASGEHGGCIGWCMFDYQTHKDFGSGDRICYHGVLDAFRNPKLAAAVYASQSEAVPVLEFGSTMDIGDYPASDLGQNYLFTNADDVVLYKNDSYVTTFAPKGGFGLPHDPIPVDDLIGDLLITEEHFGKKKARLVRECLLAVQKYGVAALPLKNKLKFLWAMKRYRLSYADGMKLYGKYIGNWGHETTVWRFDARKNGEVVKSIRRAPGRILHLDVKVDHTVLHEGDCYDMAAVRIRILDEQDTTAVYAQAPIGLIAEGPIEIIGPSVITAEGGMTGTYIRTTGKSGTAVLTLTSTVTDPVMISFTVLN